MLYLGMANCAKFGLKLRLKCAVDCDILFRLQTMYKSSRLDVVCKSILGTGTYEHTAPELAFGAQLAWRNASRCIGRIAWSNLQVYIHSMLSFTVMLSYISVRTCLYLLCIFSSGSRAVGLIE